MSRPSSSASTLGELGEELTFNEALLNSLEDQTGVEKQRDEISDKIKTLKEQIAKMQQPLPNWGSLNTNRNIVNQSSANGSLTPYSSIATSYYDPFNTDSANMSMTLPSRKRPRDDFDDEFDTLTVPGNRSRHTAMSRTVSPARSTDSFGTDFSEDPLLRRLLGNDYGDERKNTERYLKELEAKKRQEDADAEFARQLQATWSQTIPSASVALKPVGPSSSYSQSLLRADGSNFQKPIVQRQETIKPEPRFAPPKITASGASTPGSDDSGLVEISSDDWIDRFGAHQRRTLPPMMTNGYPFGNNNNMMRMPGAFPGVNHQLFSNTPGSSVYGNSPYANSQYNSSTSSLNNSFNSFNPPGKNSLVNGFPGPALLNSGVGSSRMPFDLDNYPPPPSLSLNFADPEQTQEEIKDLLKHIRPDEDLTPEQLAEIQPVGLKFNLMPHQRKGYAWLKSMEEGTNMGGILADDMGLGKTIQALALILGRPPVDTDGNRIQKPTLIVAPVALMQQWEREIERMIHRAHRLNVLILHGSNRNSSWNEIKNYDVVLTTYGLLASDLKRKDLWDKHLKMVPDAKPSASQQCPVLGDRSRFHRIILDEAQNIKNKSTKAALAACRVQADYRWCLSGTPMQNNVDEIHSLLKFCRIRPYNDSDKFARDIGRPLKSKQVYFGRDRAMEKLQALLRACLLRRTKKSEIDGQPIIQLPAKHTVEDRTVFSKDDLDFYKALEAKAQIQFNKYLKNGTVGRNYSHALVLLLRLRQCCCSPQLVTNAKDFLVNGALQDLDYIENARLLPKDVIRRLSELDGFECPICMDGVENPVIFNQCGHALCQECLSTMVDKAMADSESHKVTCPHCRAEIDTNKVTDYESFLRVHFPDRPGVKPLDDEGDNNGEVAEETDDENSSSSESEEDENDDGEDLKGFIVPDDAEVAYDTDASESTKKKAHKKPSASADTDEELDSKNKIKKSLNFISESGTRQGKHKSKEKRSKGKKKAKPDIKTLAQLRAEGLRSRAAKKKYIRRLGRGFQPSSKIEKTIQLLKDIRDNGQGEKTIIFSSFTSFLDLLEVAMNRDDEDLGDYSRYDGSMSARDRNDAVNRFTDSPHCKAILVSLKAGNAGLNLTAANHVIILDPFWNPFVEYQAADRCYRIGQLKEVTIHRVLIGEGDEDGNLIEQPQGSERVFTVEDRILALQEKKRELVETALDETASVNIGRLGTRELGFLFGVNSM